MLTQGIFNPNRRRPADIALGLCREQSEPDDRECLDLAPILELLHAQTSHDFSEYKRSTLLWSIHKRMAAFGMEDTYEYARYLEKHAEEIHLVVRKLLIGVTRFFRDPQAFETLKRLALPGLLRSKAPGDILRAWVPGCATGEEAYSLAVLFHEAMEETGQACSVRISATDINERSVATATTGAFPLDIAQAVTPRRRSRFFLRAKQGYRLKDEIRAMVIFAVQNVIRHAPSVPVDLISCRNLLIYLEPDLQDSLIATFHRALRPGGVLFLSPSESIGDRMDLFTPLSRRWKLYRANPSGALDEPRTCGTWHARSSSC